MDGWIQADSKPLNTRILTFNPVTMKSLGPQRTITSLLVDSFVLQAAELGYSQSFSVVVEKKVLQVYVVTRHNLHVSPSGCPVHLTPLFHMYSHSEV